MGSLREHVRPGSNTDYTIVQSLDTKRGGPDDNEAQAGHLVATLRVGGRADGAGSSYDNTPWTTDGGSVSGDDPLLPLGLDSHRYRCCGNGVVAPVAEAIGRALAAEIA